MVEEGEGERESGKMKENKKEEEKEEDKEWKSYLRKKNRARQEKPVLEGGGV